MVVSYRNIFEGIVDKLVCFEFDDTKEVTQKIKEYFHQSYENDTHHVLSSLNSTSKEYLLDVLVTNFRPLNVIAQDGRKFKLANSAPQVFLAVESELGGVSASGPLNVQRNAIEDFIKLTLINSEYKVMIFTSLKYKGEDTSSYITDRFADFAEIYNNSMANENGLLLIHIESTEESGKQVKVDLRNKNNFTGLILNKNEEPVFIE